MEIKRYNVVIRGKVQDIGFRNFIAQSADFLRLKGYVFNDIDGSVKLILEGVKDTLDSFLDDVKIKTSGIGAEIESLDRREVSRDSDLPPKFVKIPSTELEEIGSKLDIGVSYLRDIKEGQEGLIKGQDTLITGQGSIATLLKDMKKLLGRIAEK
ncbi:MAG: acylphosphatase [Candidatus Hydrothermarchaeota archaeon]|nr:acylphosphatase [Candidatus Hydrothermarchaeota archaeon]